jgi:hypothetical protein
MKTSSLAILLISVFLLSISLFWLGFSSFYYLKNLSFVYARGVNGFGGESVVLTCPSGKTIHINDVKPPILGCSDISSQNPIQPACDPFLLNGLPDPSNTINMLPQLQSQCDGKGSCTFQIPNLTGKCGGGCSASQLMGSYYCR